MKKYRIFLTVTDVETYEVMAKNEDEAMDIVMMGKAEPVSIQSIDSQIEMEGEV